MTEFRISQLADRVGVPASTLRFYEQQGLLRAARSPSGYRLYDLQAVERLGFIAAAKHLGLPLVQIRELVGVWESGLCVQVQDRMRPMLQESVGAANGRMAELKLFVDRLQRALTRLDGVTRAGRCDPSCDFLLRSDEPSPGRASPVAALRSEPPKPGEDTGSGSSLALACSATSVGRAEQLRRWARLVADATTTRFMGGFTLRLPISQLTTAADVAAAEQACCPFFDVQLVLAGPVFDLQVRAADEAAALLDELLGASA